MDVLFLQTQFTCLNEGIFLNVYICHSDSNGDRLLLGHEMRPGHSFVIHAIGQGKPGCSFVLWGLIGCLFKAGIYSYSQAFIQRQVLIHEQTVLYFLMFNFKDIYTVSQG